MPWATRRAAQSYAAAAARIITASAAALSASIALKAAR